MQRCRQGSFGAIKCLPTGISRMRPYLDRSIFDIERAVRYHLPIVVDRYGKSSNIRFYSFFLRNEYAFHKNVAIVETPRRGVF